MRKEEYLQSILGALGVCEDKGVPDPAWRHEEYLKAIYEAAKGVEANVEDLDERVSELEENTLSPEDVQTVMDNYMDEHSELIHLGFYRDSDGDLCQSDE